jgi:hypothetical protein
MIEFTTGPDDPNAPGCYGSALTFKPDALECKGCMFAARCGPLSAERLDALRARLGITGVPAPRKARVTLSDIATAGPTLTNVLPKKVAELMERLERAGIKVTESFARGENPFTEKGKPAFLLITAHLLLNLQRGLGREELVRAYQKKLNWSLGTATAHAAQACQLLVALGAATEANGQLHLKRTA